MIHTHILTHKTRLLLFVTELGEGRETRGRREGGGRREWREGGGSREGRRNVLLIIIPEPEITIQHLPSLTSSGLILSPSHPEGIQS